MMPSAQDLAKSIRLLLLDVDGVLTNGTITYDSAGNELKTFHIHDGLGIKLLQRNGVSVGIITGRNSPMVSRRANELGITLIIQGREDKGAALLDVQQETGLPLASIAYMGDDLPDIAAIRLAGLGIAPANATAYVQQHADWVTHRAGGNGAVREAAEFILDAQGLLTVATRPYLDPHP